MSLKKIIQLLIVFFLPFMVKAQVTTSSIVGVITSSSGTPIEGASIKATHTPSGTVYRTVSRSGGNFTLPNMRVGGPYTIEVTYVGLETQTYNDIYLQLGEDTKLSPVLVDKSQSLTDVTVATRRNSLISKDRTGPTMQISQQQLQALPTITRNINDFARMLPQAQARSSATDGSTMGITFAGQSNKYNQFSIDGVNASDIFGLSASGTNGGQAGINPIPFDAIDQVQVVLAPYDVAQGGFTGGGINAVTRSGTNEYHGSVYGFYQNQSLVGKSPNDGSKFGKFHDGTFGARIGGPIIKDKLFFFANYEGERRSSPIQNQPGTAGSNVDMNTITQLSKWLEDESNHPGWSYNPGAINGINQTRNSDAVFARIDWNINSKNKLTIRNSYTSGNSFIISDGQNNMSFYNNGYSFKSKNNSTVLELNSNISSQYSNMLRVTYTSTRDSRQVPGDATFPNVQIKDGSLTYYIGPDYSSVANKLNQDIYTLVDNFNIYAGKHTITLGTNNEFYNTNNIFVQNANGRYIYNSLSDFYNNAQPGSYYYYSPTQPGGDGASKIHAAQFSLYAQDAYNINSKFKLTYGLRADIPVFFNKPDANDAFNASQFATQYDVATNKVPKTTILLSPRVGFNWDVNGNKSTQIRGGAGIFTGRVPLVWISNQYGGTGTLLNKYTAPKGDLPNIKFNPVTPPTGAGSKVNEVDVTAHNFKFPRTFRANLAIDQQLPYGLIGTIEGIYTKTLEDINYQDLNLAPSTGTLTLGNTTRPFYGSHIDATDYSNVMLLKNTTIGHAYNVSIEIQRPVATDGWTGMAAFNIGHSYGLNDGTSSVALSNWRYAYNTNGLNNLSEGRNNYDQGSSIKAYIAKRFTYANNHVYSQVGLVYNGYQGQVFSYVYYGDINGDDGTSATSVNTSNSADLMYLPTSASDFAPLYTTDKSGNVTGVKYTSEQEFAQFQTYMNSTDYTKKNEGKNTTRNGARLPWENHFDLKFVQGFKFAKTQSIELSVNIFNVSNLLNDKWGHAYYLSNQEAQPLDVANPTQAAKFSGSNVPVAQQYTTFDPTHPKVTFDPAYGLNKYTGKPWGYADYLSRWSMQIGIRYSF